MGIIQLSRPQPNSEKPTQKEARESKQPELKYKLLSVVKELEVPQEMANKL